MDEALHGTRDRRGHWSPKDPIKGPPIWDWPAQPRAVARWLLGWDGYILPWNLLYALAGIGTWLWLTPSFETMRSFEPGWILLILLRNAAIVTLWCGGFHLWLYMRRSQGTSFKYNAKWPEGEDESFLFRSQTRANIFWTYLSGVPIWTAWEVVTLWLYATGRIPYLDPAAHPVLFVLVFLTIPLFREAHFYAVHRLIHWPPLYRSVHKLHHANVNPGPWSGLSMHPVEHLLYFSGVAIHWIVPSHPMHAINHLLHAAMSPAQGHTGFEKLVMGDERAMNTHAYAHYLHHKYFEVNYADGNVPFDRLFGTNHDGSKEADERMDRRTRERADRARAAKARRP